MDRYSWTALATLIALVVYFWMGLRVGGARSKYKVAAPAMSGDPIFERHFRVQMNTLEWLPIFLPALWMFATYWGDQIAAAIGGFWIVGRIIYMVMYVRDPGTRGLGFSIQVLSALALVIGSFIGVGIELFHRM